MEFTGQTVFIIDDSKVFLKYMKMALADENLNVVTFEEEMGHLDALTAANPDIILTDYEMPKITGPEICKLVKKCENLRNAMSFNR